MKAALKNKISPPVFRGNKAFNEKKTEDFTAKSSGKQDINFKEVLLNSNREVARKRQAEENGDLSGAKNYQDFLDALNKKTKQDDLPKNTMGKDDFLTLFITQLQQQDPLNPKDGTEMASQLAQFNSLEQMMNMNTALKGLDEKASTGHDLQFVNYIGKEVAIQDGRMRLDKGQTSDITFKIDKPIASSALEVRDATGTLVSRVELGPKQPGEHSIAWDGKNEKGELIMDGVYTVGLTGKANKSTIDIPLTTRVTITGVDLKEKNSAFFTKLGRVTYQDISEIGTPGYAKAAKNKELVEVENKTATKKTKKEDLKKEIQTINKGK